METFQITKITAEYFWNFLVCKFYENSSVTFLKESASSQKESTDVKSNCNHMSISIVLTGRTNWRTGKKVSINSEEKFLPVLVKLFPVDIHYTKKWSITLRIFLVNVTRSAVSCGFGHIYWRNS